MEFGLSFLGPAALGAFVGILAHRILLGAKSLGSSLTYVILAAAAGFVVVYLLESFEPSFTQIVYYAVGYIVGFLLGDALGTAARDQETGSGGAAKAT